LLWLLLWWVLELWLLDEFLVIIPFKCLISLNIDFELCGYGMKSRMVKHSYDVQLLCILKFSITWYSINIKKHCRNFSRSINNWNCMILWMNEFLYIWKNYTEVFTIITKEITWKLCVTIRNFYTLLQSGMLHKI
jgi:hypothetical protein